ncbi:hypothetical protein OSB04_006383 [Centaurea solstitialis]|uniref:Uncharacterized protein n=1 Tax=Centaurea solstitialis TaxID=347529 RepID=A0AA38THT8_9ASTR|nr:hypothetical protein OSB04_006383 [Centaurea solstitialis]
MVVSVSHREITQLPLATHSESVGVELREDQPHLSTSLSAPRVIEPLTGIFDIPSIFRTRSRVTQAELPRDSARTKVVGASGDALRGSFGSPGTVNIMTGVQTGRESTSLGLFSSTGAHEALGVVPLGPGPTDLGKVSKDAHRLDEANAARDSRVEALERALAETKQKRRAELEASRKLQEDRDRELYKIKRRLKGKHVEDSPSTKAPIARQSEDVLRLAPPTSGTLPDIPGYVTEAEHEYMIASYTTQNDRLSAQAQPSKRRHDDPNDSAPGPHEGELQASKRLRIDFPPASGSGSSSTPASTTAPQSAPSESAVLFYEDSVTETVDVEEWHYESIPLDEVIQFPHEKTTADVDVIPPKSAPTDPNELQIPEEARKILRPLAQSLRIYKKGDDILSSSTRITRSSFDHSSGNPFQGSISKRSYTCDSERCTSGSRIGRSSDEELLTSTKGYATGRHTDDNGFGVGSPRPHRSHQVLARPDPPPPKYYPDGLEVLKRYVRHAITLARVTDYQLAIESRQPKVNLLRPNLHVPAIGSYYLYIPSKVPKYGVVYLTQKKKERKFMQFGELAQFCDGTLLYVYNGLKSRLLTDQIPPTKHNDGKAKVLEEMNLIEEKLKERLMYRRVEAAMRMRARIIGDWEEFLQLSKIINFCPIAGHSGVLIGRAVEKCLVEWGIRNVLTVTVDNASSNDLAIQHLNTFFNHWECGVLEGSFLHMRCAAHILNLVVKDGLSEVIHSVKKVRAFVRYVRSSPTRLNTFKSSIQEED